MLKIKDNINLKILLQYDFRLNNKKWYSLGIEGANLLVKPISREILIDSYSTNEYHNPEKLYDLIQDGLVEKV